MKQNVPPVGGADRKPSPLLEAVSACKEHVFYAGLFSACVNLLFLAPSAYMLQVYDRAIPTRGGFTLFFLTLIFLFALCTLSGLDHMRSRLLVGASVRLDRRLAPKIVGMILSRSTGQRTSELLREFDVLRQTMTGPAVLALMDAPWAPVYVLICFLLHPALGALALAGAAALLAVTLLNERTTKAPLQRANQRAAVAYQMLDQTAAATGVIRALGMKSALLQRHLDDRMSFVQLQAEVNHKSGAYLTLTKFLRLLLQSLSLGLGAWLVMKDQLSPGAVFAASLLVTRALAPVEQLVGAWRSLVTARGVYARLHQLFDELPPERTRTRLPEPSGQLQVDNVSVATPALDRFVLQNVSFSIEPGESIGVVGPSGAGKSTLARVIAGALDPLQGAIRFDGAEARDWDEDQLAQHIGYVPQEPTLFPGTVKENIARFRNHLITDARVLDEQVVAAAQACGAHDLIVRLPQAYETVLGPNGSGLSAGQAQRIALARAFFGRPRLVILDEPNAHLDAEGEAALVRALGRLKEKKVSVITIAHRTGILQCIDKLLVLQGGRVVSFGPKDEVTERLQAARETPARPFRVMGAPA